MNISEDKFCPILLAGMRLKTKECKCLREKCEWYGNGCPAYPTQLEIDIFNEDKKFYKELEEKGAKSD